MCIKINTPFLKRGEIVMPSLNLNFIKSLKDDYKKFPCFVETGTFNGETIFEMEPYFSDLYTIEVSELYHKRTKSRYFGNKIDFIYGDSSKVFQDLLPSIEKNTIFFLDGHWSSGDTGKAEKDCPLYEEISHINNLFKGESIIIIDDFRLFGLGPKDGTLNEDWSDINKENILKILDKRITQTYHLDSVCAKDDRLIIHIDAKE